MREATYSNFCMIYISTIRSTLLKNWKEEHRRIKGLYEVHLSVSDLQKSIEFYRKLRLELTYVQEKLGFFWIVKGKFPFILDEDRQVL